MADCQCMKCSDRREEKIINSAKAYYLPQNFRYACEICGNKRCPHHTNHVLACTGSNEPGQPGSSFK